MAISFNKGQFVDALNKIYSQILLKKLGRGSYHIAAALCSALPGARRGRRGITLTSFLYSFLLGTAVVKQVQRF